MLVACAITYIGFQSQILHSSHLDIASSHLDIGMNLCIWNDSGIFCLEQVKKLHMDLSWHALNSMLQVKTITLKS